MALVKKLLKYEHYIALLAIPVFWLVLTGLIQGGSSYWLKFWWMFPIALIIALIVNTLGISGAALFVPFFILLFPLLSMPLTAAQSVKLGLITESFGLSSSALAFIRFGLVDKKLALYSMLGAMPLVVAGALMTSFIPKSVLMVMIAALLIIATGLVKYKNKLKERRLHELSSQSMDYTEPVGEKVSLVSQDGKSYHYCRTKTGYRKRFFGYGLGGFFQGASGFGIGEIGIISMILSNIPTRIAIGTSHMVVASTAIVASIIHISLASSAGDAVPWNLPFMTVPAVIIGGQLAPYVAAKLPSKLLEKFISLLFLVIAMALIILALKG